VELTIEIPDTIAEQIERTSGSISRELLEAFAIEGYRTEKLSRGQVAELLGLSFWQTEEFLRSHDALLHYDLNDLDQDRESLHKTSSR